MIPGGNPLAVAPLADAPFRYMIMSITNSSGVTLANKISTSISLTGPNATTLAHKTSKVTSATGPNAVTLGHSADKLISIADAQSVVLAMVLKRPLVVTGSNVVSLVRSLSRTISITGSNAVTLAVGKFLHTVISVSQTSSILFKNLISKVFSIAQASNVSFTSIAPLVLARNFKGDSTSFSGQRAHHMVDFVYGNQSELNISSQTVVKTGTGRIIKLNVTTAGTTAGSVNDCATTGAVAAANLIFTIPNTVGVYVLDFPTLVGLVITPGSGQVVSISFD